jgi:hypothetical protein
MSRTKAPTAAVSAAPCAARAVRSEIKAMGSAMPQRLAPALMKAF